MAKWVIAAKKADFNQIGENFGISPILARIIRNRDVISDADIHKYLRGTMEDLYRPDQMKNMVEAASMIADLIQDGKKIRIIGDYDVDGVCAAYILETGLRYLGADVDTAIPHRIKDGYGLNEHLIQDAYEEGREVLITCDNGIAAMEQIALANSLGMTVIVTDHHEVPFVESEWGEKQYKLPPAAIIVDPKQADETYPFSGICGAVVAWKLMIQLLEQTGHSDAQGKALLLELLEFAAIATVGDVMILQDENRIIVKEGLERISHTHNIGLKALLMANDLWDKAVTAFHIGFVIGPCLNATGRLDTAIRALELFRCEDAAKAAVLAQELKELNDERKGLTQDGVVKAIEMAASPEYEKDSVLVLYLPECHESLAGIIAGKVRERFYKPVFILTDGDEMVKGSGRSIENYDMYEQMSACQELFEKYGGHKMAGGLSLKKENVALFRKKINDICTLTPADLEEKLVIDVPLPMGYATKNLIQELELLAPFGNGNSKPLFADKEVALLKGTIIGKNKNFAKYTVGDTAGNRYEMIYFGDLEAFHNFLDERFGDKAREALYRGKTDGKMKINVMYYPQINTFRDMETVQLQMTGYC